MILAEITVKKKGSVKKLSLVKSPAIGVDFLKLAEERPLKLAIDELKHNLTGPVLIADQWYYRKPEFFKGMGEEGEDGYIKFSQDAIIDVGMDLLRAGNQMILNHETDVPTEDIELVESWFIETSHDKAYDLGFTEEQCPINKTLMQTQHVNDEKIWQDALDGKYNGFSIQGAPTVEILAKGLDSVRMKIEFDEDRIIAELTEVIKNYKE